MNGECYFCHGLVLEHEDGHLLLDGHADHEVFVHESCAEGQGAIEEPRGTSGELAVRCPECGAVETV